MNKSQKLAAKIEALKAELSAARVAEKTAAAKAARLEIERACRASGLTGLVAAGGLSSEALAGEFRAAAERLKAGSPAPVPPASAAAAEEKRGWFGGRE